MGRRRLVVAINPNASFGKATDAGPRVVELLREAGHEVRPLVAPTWEVLAERARDALATRPDAFVVVGGDGMVHLAAQLLTGDARDIPLGLIPVGTGNDLAIAAGIPAHDVAVAVAYLLAALEDAGPVTIDAGVAEWEEGGSLRQRRFVGAVSCGFDALVNERANRMTWPKGRSRYTLAIGLELANLRPIDYRIEHDGGVLETTGVLVAVANNRSIGGGMLITPDGSLRDGRLDVFVVEALSRSAFLRLYPQVFQGTHVSDPRVTIIRTTQARVEAAGPRNPLVAYADGERLGPLPVQVRIEPASLRFLGQVGG